jgi:hypothetical protein
MSTVEQPSNHGSLARPHWRHVVADIQRHREQRATLLLARKSILQIEATSEKPPDDLTAKRSIVRFGIKQSWVISTIVHTVLILVLSTLTYRSSPITRVLVIVGGAIESPTAPQLAIPTIGLSSHPPPGLSLTARAQDPGSIDLASQLRPPPTSLLLGSAAMHSTTAIDGSLFEAQNVGLAIDGEGQSGAQFYGIQARGNRFVFVVDSSTSMLRKFPDVKRELEYAIRQLSPHQKFYVIFFDNNAERLTLGKWNDRHTKFKFNADPEPALVPATNENIDAFVRWMNTIRLQPNTNPFSAMVFAVNKLVPEAIFLLSDGEFTENGITERFLAEQNVLDESVDSPVPKCVIHCIGFYSRHGEGTLKRIANQHGGTYRFITRPVTHRDRLSRRKVRAPAP